MVDLKGSVASAGRTSGKEWPKACTVDSTKEDSGPTQCLVMEASAEHRRAAVKGLATATVDTAAACRTVCSQEARVRAAATAVSSRSSTGTAARPGTAAAIKADTGNRVVLSMCNLAIEISVTSLSLKVSVIVMSFEIKRVSCFKCVVLLNRGIITGSGRTKSSSVIPIVYSNHMRTCRLSLNRCYFYLAKLAHRSRTHIREAEKSLV